MNPILQTLPLALLAGALVLIHCLIGGTRPVFCLPAYALLAVAGVLAFRSPRFHPAGPSRCILATGLLFSYLLARLALSPVPYLARADFFLMLGCLLVYLLTARVLVASRQRIVVVGVLLALGIVHTGVGIAQAAQGEDFMLFGFIRAANGSRASGLYVSPNHFAGFLEIVGVLGLSLAWWSARKPGVRVFAGYCTLVCYIGLLLSQSRGGVLCAVVALIAWMALTFRAGYLGNPRGFSRVLILGIAVLALLLCIGGWFVAQHIDLSERLATTFGRDIRISNWKAALMQFHSAPIFGTGAGTHLYLGRLYRHPELQLDPVHAHSDYLELLAEYGAVGAAGMVVFLGLHAVCGLRAMGRLARALREKGGSGSDELALVVGALAAFAGLAVHSALDFNLHIPGNALVMAFLFGILAQPEQTQENRALTAAPAPRASARIALATLGAIVLPLAALLWPGEFLSERARLALRDEEYPDAIAFATRSVRLDPWNPFTFFHLGEACRLQAEFGEDYATRKAHREQADQAFQQGLRLFPQDENLLVRRAQVLDRLQRFDEADASYRAAMAADPQLLILPQLYEKHRALRESALPAPAR
jgi:O-antigen ligase